MHLLQPCNRRVWMDSRTEKAMVYLSASDFESYGVDLATPSALIGAVSALIDAHCKRPTLAPVQYTERLRLMADASVVRLTRWSAMSSCRVCRVRHWQIAS